MKKLWGGRFDGVTDRRVEQFTGSLSLDARLLSADLKASLAHARMLTAVGVLTADEGKKIENGLMALTEEFASGKRALNPSAEDVHSEIESQLKEIIGDLAGKLHTARSRNDQVATAMRLYLLEETSGLSSDIKSFQSTLVALAEKHLETLLPGTTHLQPAQPVSLAHHLMAYFWMLERDRGRVEDARKRASSLPLGSGALAGTTFPIDREKVQKELGFAAICENSLDAVSDRDFVLEFLGAASLTLLHLSRLAEELILWSTPQYGFVTLSDSTTTGSSMMPQKKNPDVAELIRGRTGRLLGSWSGFANVLKGLPLSYNRDLQEDKFHMFDALDTTRGCVQLMELLITEAKFNVGAMAQAAGKDFMNATDLADALVTEGVAFRDAHEIVGKMVRDCLKENKALEDLPANARLKEKLTPQNVLAARKSRGGTAPSAVTFQIQKAKELL